MSVCVVRSNPGRNCTGAAVVRKRCGEYAGWILIDSKMADPKIDFHRLGLVSPADHLEGVRRLPNNSKKQSDFEARKRWRSNWRSKPRPEYPTVLWWCGKCAVVIKTTAPERIIM